MARPGSIGPAVDPALTTKVVEFNDVDALAEALAPRDVACVLAEPALTNIGIVLPEPGFLDALRRLTTETGTLAHHRRDPHVVRGPRWLHRGARPPTRHAHRGQAVWPVDCRPPRSA